MPRRRPRTCRPPPHRSQRRTTRRPRRTWRAPATATSATRTSAREHIDKATERIRETRNRRKGGGREGEDDDEDDKIQRERRRCEGYNDSCAAHATLAPGTKRWRNLRFPMWRRRSERARNSCASSIRATEEGETEGEGERREGNRDRREVVGDPDPPAHSIAHTTNREHGAVRGRHQQPGAEGGEGQGRRWVYRKHPNIQSTAQAGHDGWRRRRTARRRCMHTRQRGTHDDSGSQRGQQRHKGEGRGRGRDKHHDECETTIRAEPHVLHERGHGINAGCSGGRRREVHRAAPPSPSPKYDTDAGETRANRRKNREQQTHRHTDTQTHRHTDTQTHRHTDTKTHQVEIQ
jgi:hypothetical protein